MAGWKSFGYKKRKAGMKTKNFHVGIKALIINNNKVLILQENKKSTTAFSLPGGRIDEGEGIDHALKRELREELGIKSYKKGKLLHVFERLDYGKKEASLMIIVYAVEANASSIKLSHEHLSYRWVGRKDLSQFNIEGETLNPEIIMVLEKVLK